MRVNIRDYEADAKEPEATHYKPANLDNIVSKHIAMHALRELRQHQEQMFPYAPTGCLCSSCVEGMQVAIFSALGELIEDQRKELVDNPNEYTEYWKLFQNLPIYIMKEGL